MEGEGGSPMKIKVKKVEKIQATATMVEYALIL
jgi:Flp pilus assembly pilin Flp